MKHSNKRRSKNKKQDGANSGFSGITSSGGNKNGSATTSGQTNHNTNVLLLPTTVVSQEAHAQQNKKKKKSNHANDQQQGQSNKKKKKKKGSTVNIAKMTPSVADATSVTTDLNKKGLINNTAPNKHDVFKRPSAQRHVDNDYQGKRGDSALKLLQHYSKSENSPLGRINEYYQKRGYGNIQSHFKEQTFISGLKSKSRTIHYYYKFRCPLTKIDYSSGIPLGLFSDCNDDDQNDTMNELTTLAKGIFGIYNTDLIPDQVCFTSKKGAKRGIAIAILENVEPNTREKDGSDGSLISCFDYLVPNDADETPTAATTTIAIDQRMTGKSRGIVKGKKKNKKKKPPSNNATNQGKSQAKKEKQEKKKKKKQTCKKEKACIKDLVQQPEKANFKTRTKIHVSRILVEQTMPRTTWFIPFVNIKINLESPPKSRKIKQKQILQKKNIRTSPVWSFTMNRRYAGPRKAWRKQRKIPILLRSLGKVSASVTNHAKQRFQERGLSSIPVYGDSKILSENNGHQIVVTYLPHKRTYRNAKEKLRVIHNELRRFKMRSQSRFAKKAYLPKESLSWQDARIMKEAKGVVAKEEHRRRLLQRKTAYGLRFKVPGGKSRLVPPKKKTKKTKPKCERDKVKSSKPQG